MKYRWEWTARDPLIWKARTCWFAAARGRRVLWSGLWECERYLAVAAGTTRICTCPSSTVSRAYTVWVLRQLFTKCINSWRPAARPSDRFMASDSYSVPGTVRGDTAAHCSTNSPVFFGESKLIYYNVWCIVIKVVGLLLQDCVFKHCLH